MDKALKHLLYALAISAALWLSPCSQAQTFDVCNNGNSSGGVTSLSCTLTYTATNHVLIWMADYPVSSVTLSLSNTFNFTWTKWVSSTFADGALTRELDIWCGYNPSSTGLDTLTQTYNGSATFTDQHVIEITGSTYTSCASAFDNHGTNSGIGTGGGSGSGSFNFVSSGATPTNSNDIVFGFCGGNVGAGTITVGAGFTELRAGVPVRLTIAEWMVASGLTSQTANCNSSATANWAISMALVCQGNCVSASTHHYFPQM